MVFEVLGTVEAPRLVNDLAGEGATSAATPAASPCAAAPAPRRPLPRGVLEQLLRSAVALQAEGMLRTVGALAGVWGDVVDSGAWIERDARDLAALAAAATAAQVRLPAGIDSGAGDPGHPSSVVEGMLAGHEALVAVLRQLASAGAGEDAAAWLPLVEGILARREDEMVFLRAVGAAGRLPGEEKYVHGSPPRH